MPRQSVHNCGPEIMLDLGDLNPKQKEFCQARSRYIAYGGARGGGKTHVLRLKAVMGALAYPGIRILVIRREYPELEQTVIIPMRKMVPAALALYNGTMHMFTFANGSIIKFGHYRANDDLEYQGQEYDWIFMDEATQFTEYQFRVLGACLRGATKIPRRMYLTCNPGGVGHFWVKRLFVSRDYKDGEDPKDYTFIAATVKDNPQLLENSPDYIRQLELLPEDKRAAWLNGDWDAMSGVFFPEASRKTHIISDFWRVPFAWRKYRAFDYGLDMLACLWIAVDYDGRAYVYREAHQSGLIVSQAARLFCESCRKVFSDLQTIQHSEKDPNDCATEPHDITHAPDALRYFAITRLLAAGSLTPRGPKRLCLSGLSTRGILPLDPLIAGVFERLPASASPFAGILRAL